LGQLDLDPATRLRNGILTRLSNVSGFYLPLMPKVSDCTKEAIRAIVTRGVEDGLEVGEAAGHIADELAPYVVGRPAKEVEALALSITETEREILFGAGSLEIAMTLAKIVEADHEKSWLVFDDNPCEKCLRNYAARWIPLEDEFPSGDLRPPAHPRCHCGLGFRHPDSRGI